VQSSARRRNARTLAEGRLTLATGDTRTAAGYAPVDLVLACHVLYFWSTRRVNCGAYARSWRRHAI
jgi:hypothetical protein